MFPSKPESSDSLIDFERGDLRPISEICFQLTGKSPSSQTNWRWRVIGCRGAKLEAVLLAGVWHTTSKAFADFIQRQTQSANKACIANAKSTARNPVTERRLQAAGLLR